MKILIIGGSSHIGYDLCKILSEHHQIISICRKPVFYHNQNNISCVLSDLDNVFKIINDISPDIVVNCIGYSDVQECSRFDATAMNVNFYFVQKLVDCVLRNDIKLIHFSSSHVFDGENSPYDEDSLVCPINIYGETKAKADEYIKSRLKKYIIIRLTSVVKNCEYFQRKLLVNIVLDKLNRGEMTKLVNDKFTNYVHIDDVVCCCRELIFLQCNGIYNIAGDKVYSPYSLCKGLIRNESDIDLLQSVSSQEFFHGFESSHSSGKLILSNLKIKKELNVKFNDIDDVLRKMVK